MAGRMSDSDVNNILNNRFGLVASTPPASYYFALVLTAPTDNVGTGLVEVSAAGYARVAVTNNTANFPAATNRVKANGTVIQWPSAGAPWGSVVGVALFDALTGGVFRAYAPLTAPVNVVAGNTPLVQVGNFTVTTPA